MRMGFILLGLVLSGCGYYHEVKTAPPGPGALGGEETLGFASVKALVFDGYCITCHSDAGGNRGGVNLESYARVLPAVGRIKASVSSGRMPLGTPLPAKEKDILLSWIEAGAPETSDLPIPGISPAPTPTPTPDVVDFARVRAEIFEPHCVACHGGFATYNVVKANLLSIESMVMSDRMPKRAPLSEPLKNLLSRWIQAGAPETSGVTPNPIPNPCLNKKGDDDEDEPCHDQQEDDLLSLN